jgi:hypothetical protein
MKKISLKLMSMAMALVSVLSLNAQITLNTTVGSTGYTGMNSSGSNSFITFVIDNTTGGSILLQDVANWTTTTDNGATYTLWYSATNLSGPVGTLAGPAWTTVASNTVSGITNTALSVNNVITNMNFLIPAGAVYRFTLFTTGTNRYSGTGPGTCTPNNFSNSGTFLRVGDHQIGGLNVGYGAVNNPRFFTGAITFIPATACTGQPTAGSAVASANPVCPSVPTSLTLNGATLGSGLTYQWQSSADGITYTNIPGATAGAYNATQTTNTYYQCIVTCTSSGLSSTSTPLLVTTSTFINCYCTSTATSPADEDIWNVSIGTLNNTSTCTTTGGAGSVLNLYSNYTTTVTPPILAATADYNLSVTIGMCGTFPYNNMTKVYIDFNQNGLFTDPGETVYASTVATNGGSTINALINIPATAAIGLTRMRVVNVETTAATAVNPCGIYTFGETEDYLVNIVPAPTCPQPTNLNLITANLTSAQLNWVPGGSETQWQIEYGPQGFTPGTGTFILVSTPPPYTINGLTSNSFYQGYVRGICTPGDTSYWAGTFNWNTYNQAQYMEWDNTCSGGFIDISGTGIPTNLLDDAEIGITLPFPFLFQATLMTDVTIADNGGIVLGTQSAQLSFSNGAIGTAPTNALVAFWDDVENSTVGNIYYQTVGTAPNQQFIVQWEQQNYWPGTTPSESITYQIVLDQATNEIYYYYEDSQFGGGTAAFDNGASATIGINGPNQDIQVSLNSSSYLSNNSCVHYYYTDCPKPAGFTIAYLAPDEAAFSWTAGIANETNWTIIYGVDGFDPATSGTTITSTNPSAVLPNLTQNTQYDVYIFADCSPVIQSNGLVGTFLTPPFCSNPTNMINNVSVDSIFSSWSWTASYPAYQVTGFNIAYGMSGYNPYSEGTEVNLDADFNDSIIDANLIGSGVYQLYVQAVCGADTSQYVGPFTVVMPLTNDTVCGAELLQVDGTLYTFNNAGATVTIGENTIAPPTTGAQTTDGWINSTLNNTTWYKFIAPPSGQMRINNTAINYAGQAAIYTTQGCFDYGLFTLIAANDNEIGGSSVAPNFTVCGLTPGAEYYLMIDGSTATTGNYSVRMTPIVLEAGSFTSVQNVCLGDTVNLWNGITGFDNGGEWTAELPSAGTGIFNDSMFSSAGLAYQVFNFEYRVVDGCAYDSIVGQVEIYGPSSAGGDGTITVCRNEPVDLLAGLTGNVDFGGTWYDPSNNAIANSEIISSNIPGQFNYDYITGNGVCPDDTANVLVTVDASCNYLSLEETFITTMNVYPNPTNGVVYLQSAVTGKAKIEVTDIEGRIVLESSDVSLGSSPYMIELDKKISGMYFIKVSNETAERNFKVIVH